MSLFDTKADFTPIPEPTREQVEAVARLVVKHVPADEVTVVLMMLGLLESPESVRLCKRGSHRMTPENTGWQGLTKVCRACQKSRRKGTVNA